MGLHLHQIQGGRQYTTNCWNCGTSILGPDNNSKGHLTIRPDKNVFRCPRCGYSGNAWVLAKDLLGDKKAIELLKNCRAYTGPLYIDAPTKPIQERNAVYSEFLKRLVLSPTHRNNLRKRGLPDSIIERNGYKTTLGWHSTEGVCNSLLKEGYSLNGIPGFYKNKYGNWSFMTLPGFLIPVKDYTGLIQGMQIRVDEPFLKQNIDLRKYIWMSSSGKTEGCSSGSPIHIANSNSKLPIHIEAWITEGPLKADIAVTYIDVTFFGLAGVSLYKQASQEALRLGVKNAIIAYDSDYLENPHVEKAEREMIVELRNKGIVAMPIKWHQSYGKGIDDVCVKLANGQIPMDRDTLKSVIEVNLDLQINLELNINLKAC